MRKLLVLALIALGAAFALPAFATAQDVADGLFDETEPQTVIDHVKVSSKKGLAKVYFSATDPVDPAEDLSYDCAVDGGNHAGGNDDADDEDDADDQGDDSDDADADDNDDADDEGDDSDDDVGEEALSSLRGDVEDDCDSPWVVTGLDHGHYTVEVTAWDVEWNEDSTPAVAQFKVKKRK